MPGRCRLVVVAAVAEIGKKKRDFPSFFMVDFFIPVAQRFKKGYWGFNVTRRMSMAEFVFFKETVEHGLTPEQRREAADFIKVMKSKPVLNRPDTRVFADAHANR